MRGALVYSEASTKLTHSKPALRTSEHFKREKGPVCHETALLPYGDDVTVAKHGRRVALVAG